MPDLVSAVHWQWELQVAGRSKVKFFPLLCGLPKALVSTRVRLTASMGLDMSQDSTL